MMGCVYADNCFYCDNQNDDDAEDDDDDENNGNRDGDYNDIKNSFLKHYHPLQYANDVIMDYCVIYNAFYF